MNQFASVLAAVLCASLPALAVAQAFPAKPIRMMTATTVGSGPDVIARLVGAKLGEIWGQQIVVDNRAGASGLIGAELVAKAAPDGYTLWMATMTQLISTTLYQRFLLAKEYTPVNMVASTPFVLATSSVLPVKSVAELIAYAKARPGQVMYGSGGQGSTPHLCMELFKTMTGIDLVHVPYKGSMIALTDMMGGQMHVTCSAAPGMPPFLQSGKVRALGVTSREPTVLAPGMPAVFETVPGFEIVGWYGLLAPLGTPNEIVAKINQGLAAALKSPEFRERLIAAGAEAVFSDAAQFAVFLKGETQRWEKVLRDAGIRPTE